MNKLTNLFMLFVLMFVNVLTSFIYAQEASGEMVISSIAILPEDQGSLDDGLTMNDLNSVEVMPDTLDNIDYGVEVLPEVFENDKTSLIDMVADMVFDDGKNFDDPESAKLYKDGEGINDQVFVESGDECGVNNLVNSGNNDYITNFVLENEEGEGFMDAYLEDSDITVKNVSDMFSAIIQGNSGSMNNFSWNNIIIGGYEIMDRNLGAMEAWDGVTSVRNYHPSYGYYYQWGNNYGFTQSETILTDTNLVSVDPSLIPSKYSSSTFILKNNTNWNENATATDSLWGYGFDLTPAKQGPCPQGYHVPSSGEWEGIYREWMSRDYKSNNFLVDLLLPPAGYVQGGSLTFTYDGTRNYFSSTPSSKEKAWTLTNTNKIEEKGRSNGRSLRCFRDVIKVKFESNNGSVVDSQLFYQVGEQVVEPEEPTRLNSIFEGWYTDESLTNKFDFDTLIDGDLTLYAKWSCKEGTISVFDNKYCTTHFESINIIGTDGTIIQTNNQIWEDLTVGDYIIMDRNLGATEPWDSITVAREYHPSYGYFYQWGNNYGFMKSNETILTDTNLVNVDSSFIPSKYGSSTFILKNNTNWNENATTTDALWGYGFDSDPAKQGPCPTGYHVPSSGEWAGIYRNWESRSGGTDNFLVDLLLPPAGYVQGGNLSFSYDGTRNYFSSTPSSIEKAWTLTDVDKIEEKGRSNGRSVRCFKDSIKVIFDSNNGSTVDTQLFYGTGECAIEPDEPIRGNSIFEGWYTDESLTNKFDFDTLIDGDLTLYAKWSCKEGTISVFDNKYCTTHFESINIIGTDGTIIQTNNQIWEDLTVVFDGVSITMMDRNLGAIDYSTGYSYNNFQSKDKNRIGYYYQWGNNYGFPAYSSIEFIGTGLVNTEGYGPGNYYASDIFITTSASQKSWDYDDSNGENPNYGNPNLWGGAPGTGSDENRKGPCPQGYHVPTIYEWRRTYNLFQVWKDTDSGVKFCDSYTNGNNNFCFPILLQLPFAGYRHFAGGGLLVVGSYGGYWSSSAGGGGHGHRLLFETSSVRTWADLRSYGFPVRCFKDSQPYELTFVRNGQVITKQNVRRWESVTKQPVAPLNTIETWYMDEEKTQLFVFGDSSYLTKSTTLYSTVTCSDPSQEWNGIKCESNDTVNKGTGYSGGGGSSVRYKGSKSILDIRPKNERTETSDVYQWAYEQGLTKYKNVSEARMDDFLNRSEMAKISSIFAIQFLDKVPSTDKKDFCSQYLDLWKVEDDTKLFIIQSCELGYMGYESNGVDTLVRFRPYTSLTVAEVATILSRIVWGNEYAEDGKDWYKGHLYAAYNYELIDDIKDPMRRITRKEAYTMLYRLNDVLAK